MSRIARTTLLAFVLAAAAAADEPPVLRYVPKHEELKYTFGGVAPVRKIQPGTMLTRKPASRPGRDGWNC